MGPGRWVCRWAAAGPVDGVAVLPHGCFGRRRARPPARLGALTSFGAAPRSPPVPSGPSGALHTSGACGVLGGLAPRLEARPGPAAPAISHAIPLRLFQTLNSDRCNCNGVLTGASLAYLVQHVAGLKPVAPLRPGLRGGVKPLAPLLAQAEPQVKPPSPLRGENAVIPGVVGLQRCWRFHWSTPGGVQRCCWFQSRHVAAPCARKSSPCKPKMAEKRCFQARWANFFAEMPLEALCWATFVAVVLVVLAVGLRYPRREPHSVTRPWHCGVRAVDNEARASCR